MAALLTAEGRFPAIQTVTRAEYENFVEVCKKAPEPNEKLIALMTIVNRAKKIGSTEE